jgi:pimeloyl-ACP methyl ester carboxylesterase
MNEKSLSIHDTPLGSESASHLLTGLDIYEIPADDGHPLSIYGINSSELKDTEDGVVRRPVLLLHGRTWSAIPVYHLMGSCANKQKSRSLMETLYDAGLQPYCMDFRGFGGTPMDATQSVVPNRCVIDAECALEFISKRHDESVLEGDGGMSGGSEPPHHLPALLGWSQGALVAQLLAQKSPEMISKLVLYGSIYDPLVRYARSPLFVNGTDVSEEDRPKNTYYSAIEDFTVEGSIEPEPAAQFAKAALLTDPYNAPWEQLFQFNNVDPARVHVPTLVVSYCILWNLMILSCHE